MRLRKIEAKKEKGILNEIVSLVVIILVCSVMFGLTFLFTASLKTQVQTTSGSTTSVAYQAVNDTEAAGATIVDYLPLLFLSIIFGIIMAVVLKVILPYVNLGRQMNGF